MSFAALQSSSSHCSALADLQFDLSTLLLRRQTMLEYHRQYYGWICQEFVGFTLADEGRYSARRSPGT